MLQRRLLIALGLALLVQGNASRAADRTLTEGQPPDVEMSAPILRAGVTLFEEAIEKDELRGAVLLVARRGKIVLHEALGWRNKEQDLPMQKDTLFRMASNTKPVTATAILMLAEEGKLGLDDNVRKHLPAWDNHRSAFIKVRHLLNHTSGLRGASPFIKPLIEKSSDYPDAPSLRAEVDRFGRLGPEEVPGTTFSYNNPGYNTLGMLIEVACDRPAREFFQERIYTPLGMQAWNYEADAPAERMARVYKREKDNWKIQWSPGDKPDWPFVRTSGGMITSAPDYARFCQMWLNGGIYNGRRILKPDTVAQAISVQTRETYTPEEFEKQTRLYGFGWTVGRDGSFAHGGSDGTYAWMDPARELIVLVFTQSPGGRNPREQFLRVVAAACND
jgi:CubicO group peptidase (beta-lactamase class C family)